MACQQITEEDNSMEFLGTDEGSLQCGKALQPETNDLPGSDPDLHSAVNDSEGEAVRTEELKPHALNFEGANSSKQHI